MPFRATLIEVSVTEEAEPMLKNCEYEIIKEDKNGTPVDIKLLKTEGGEIQLFNKGTETHFSHAEKTDIKEKALIIVIVYKYNEFTLIQNSKAENR